MALTVDEVMAICGQIPDEEWRKAEGARYAAISIDRRCIVGTGDKPRALRLKWQDELESEQIYVVPNRYPSKGVHRQ